MDGGQGFMNNFFFNTTKKLYEFTFVRFGDLLHIITNQGTHCINEVIWYIIEHFLMCHTNYTTYHPHGNG
jgi:hypothetical protein